MDIHVERAMRDLADSHRSLIRLAGDSASHVPRASAMEIEAALLQMAWQQVEHVKELGEMFDAVWCVGCADTIEIMTKSEFEIHLKEVHR